jgi:type I restriction enzyme M protein
MTKKTKQQAIQVCADWAGLAGPTLVDASREYQEGKKQNRLRIQDIEKIAQTYKKFETVEKYSYRATLDEIKENDFNLNIPRYVDTFEEEEQVNIKATQKEIEKLEAELVGVRKEMNKYLKELGFLK